MKQNMSDIPSRLKRIPALKNRPAVLGGKVAFKTPVPITVPTISSIDKLTKSYKELLRGGMITSFTKVQELEQAVAGYLGTKYAVALSSCTSGLMLLMKALNLKGDILLPSFTFHATAHAAVWNGLNPVFVDCDLHTYNIDPVKVEKAITPKTSAILGVHIFGNPANVAGLAKIAKQTGLKLIFDSAHAFGSVYRGQNIGGFGDAEVFSFSPTKLVTCGEGGIVVTNDAAIAQKIRVGRNYGDPGTYDPEFVGLNARMTEFAAILGIENLKMIERNVNKRNRLASLYKEKLSRLPGISFQRIEKDSRSNFKDFSILIDKNRFGLSRDVLYDALLAENILVKKYFYPPVHEQKAYAALLKGKARLTNTEYISRNCLSLPVYSHMPVADVARICSVIDRIHAHQDGIKKTKHVE